MRGIFSFLTLVFVVAIGLMIYRSYFVGPGGVATMGTDNPRAIVDVTGVRNDLMMMAQAQRAFHALNGRYAPLAELQSSGNLVMDPSRGRLGYTYSSSVTATSFRITATFSGPATGMPTLSIDQSMQIAESR
jgi:hypothetical protein